MSQDNTEVDTTVLGGQPSQFDYLLAAIPLALLAGVGSVLLFPIPQFIGMILGAGPAAALVGYSVYAFVQSRPTAEPPLRGQPNQSD